MCSSDLRWWNAAQGNPILDAAGLRPLPVNGRLVHSLDGRNIDHRGHDLLHDRRKARRRPAAARCVKPICLSATQNRHRDSERKNDRSPSTRQLQEKDEHRKSFHDRAGFVRQGAVPTLASFMMPSIIYYVF